MIYLSGVTNDRDEPALLAAGVGLMVQPGNSYHLRVPRFETNGWAADNGCFSGKWEEDTHLAWLDRLPRAGCLFAVSPDVYPSAIESMERGLSYAPLLRELGFPVAVVAQDGAEELDWPWEEFDCLFIGGEARPDDPRKEWKISMAAEHLAHEARRQGLWVHMGRVSSLRRMRRARDMGCLSVDGTFLKWRKRQRVTDHEGARDQRGANELDAWGQWLRANPPLPLQRHETPSHPNHRRVA